MARKRPDQAKNRSQAPRRPRKRSKAGGRPFKPGESGNKATQFSPGVSGNPAGRPPLPVDYKLAIDELGPRGLQAISAILDDPLHPRHQQTAEYVVNRWKGKPRQMVELSGPDGKPVKVEGDDPVTVMVRAMLAKKATEGGDGGGAG